MQHDEATHERLAERLANILTQLNMGQQLSVKALADEFKVSTRTISRDFDRLSASLPLLKDDVSKKYYLPISYLGKITHKDIRNFAQLSGIRDLYPSLDISFLRELLDHRANQTYSTKGYSLEDASQFKALFKVFSVAIQQHKQVTFLYRGEPKSVSPYRLIHHHGNWYLAATFENELRAYRLSRIELLSDQSMCVDFEVDPEILAQLENEETIWFGQEKTEVVLKVDAEVAIHFQARALLPEQQVIKFLDDGGLLVSSRIVHTKQILPLVRYWVPHLKIISPEGLQDEMELGLMQYLSKTPN
ncbi:helix-turn-helix transcriptional regulator [Acinetobacter rudis]|uniref:WYL domain-containing protein n=1 Tax=Acinetobacter rudis TaxID=632955 RepID=A0AAW8J9Q1_9GAMM|nr:WYL domain-containing protein [Acinetobacter rudis]MDQ8936247.1 WYL domain-containing protein [Acinetobacter rudis]MDQ9018510.1 WYL domain-containing protein [Acinetobacter rudis]